MYINRFELHMFKPLLHNQIRHVVVDDLSQLTILCAPNGFGKTSILSELTPYPACRSDYEKNGKKIIEVTHEKSYYILTSDFSKKDGSHSFIKDDEELNKSGTTDVQASLVEQHLGYLPIIDKLMSGEYQICSMGTPARKELIYSTYPSSLSFILDKYTNLKSRIRVVANQLKMLNERKLKLTDLLLKEDTLKHYEQYRKDLNEALSVLDKELYLTNKTCDDVRQQRKQLDQEMDEITRNLSFETIHSLCSELSKAMFELKLAHEVDLAVPSQLDRLTGKLSAQVESQREKKGSLTERGTKLRDELDKLRESLKNDTASAIKECETMIATQKEIISANTIEDDTPVIPLSEAELMEDASDLVLEDLRTLRSMGEMIPHKEFNDYLTELTLKEATLENMKSELDRVSGVILQLTDKLSKLLDKHSYPKDCVRSCKLKANFESVVKSVQVELDQYTETYKRESQKAKDLQTRVDKIKTIVEAQRPGRVLLLKLEGLFTRKSWGDFVCSGLDPLEAINQDITKIHNRYLKIITKSKAHDKVKEAKDKLTGLEAKLAGLKASDQPIKEYVTKALVDKEYELELIGRQLTELDRMLGSSELSLQVYKDHLNLHNRITELNNRYLQWKQLFIRDQEISCLNDMSWYLQDVKFQIQARLRELDTIVKEQDGYLARLRDEIEPSIREKNDRIKKLSAIAEQLSPSSGIPYKYTIRYINSVFVRANQIIRKVWNYDIELAYIDENKQENFDFSFKMIFNQRSDIKDIKLCSKSQKSIVNLAVRLAFCIYRGYIHNFPLKLDEIDDGMSPLHRNKLTEFLSDLLQQKDIVQAFLVDWFVSISTSVVKAGLVVLAEDDAMPENGTIKSKVS